jgi:hypothetical protein
MVEVKSAWVRALFFALLIANVIALVYLAFRSDPQAGARTRIGELQINPARIQLLGAATRGGGQPSDAAKGGKAAADAPCLEWAPFSADSAAGAEKALARLALPQSAIRRTLGEQGGTPRFAYVVREPDTATLARMAELQKDFPGTELKAAPCAAENTRAPR